MNITLPTSATNGTPATKGILQPDDYAPKLIAEWKGFKCYDCGPFYWIGNTLSGADSTAMTEGQVLFTLPSTVIVGETLNGNYYRAPGFGLTNNSQALLTYNTGNRQLTITNFGAGGNKQNNYYGFQPMILPKGKMGNTPAYTDNATVGGETKTLELEALLNYNGGAAGDWAWNGTAPVQNTSYTWWKWYDWRCLTLANYTLSFTTGTGWTTIGTVSAANRPMAPTCGSMWGYDNTRKVSHIIPVRLNTDGTLQIAIPIAQANQQIWGQIFWVCNTAAAGNGKVANLTLPASATDATPVTKQLALEGYHRGWAERVANWPSGMGGMGINISARKGWGFQSGEQTGAISSSLATGSWWTVATAGAQWQPSIEVLWLYNQITDNTDKQGVRSYSCPMNGRYAVNGAWMLAQNSGAAATVKSPNYQFVYPQNLTAV